MKDFVTHISLKKFFELGGTLNKGAALFCEKAPCTFISKRMKNYRRYPEDKPIKVMHYKVRMETDWLYPKGHEIDLFDTEIEVALKVRSVAVITGEPDIWDSNM